MASRFGSVGVLPRRGARLVHGHGPTSSSRMPAKGPLGVLLSAGGLPSQCCVFSLQGAQLLIVTKHVNSIQAGGGEVNPWQNLCSQQMSLQVKRQLYQIQLAFISDSFCLLFVVFHTRVLFPWQKTRWHGLLTGTLTGRSPVKSWKWLPSFIKRAVANCFLNNFVFLCQVKNESRRLNRQRRF